MGSSRIWSRLPRNHWAEKPPHPGLFPAMRLRSAHITHTVPQLGREPSSDEWTVPHFRAATHFATRPPPHSDPRFFLTLHVTDTENCQLVGVTQLRVI